MWQFLVRLILRNRPAILVVIGLLTIFMAWQGSKVQMSYEMARMLPKDNPYNVEYEDFKKQFGQDGSVIFVAIKDTGLYSLEHFNAWYDLSYDILGMEGVQEVLSTARIYNLTRNDSLKKFDFLNIVPQRPVDQQTVDSIRDVIYQLKLYDGLLFNRETGVTLMMITLTREILIDRIWGAVYCGHGLPR